MPWKRLVAAVTFLLSVFLTAPAEAGWHVAEPNCTNQDFGNDYWGAVTYLIGTCYQQDVNNFWAGGFTYLDGLFFNMCQKWVGGEILCSPGAVLNCDPPQVQSGAGCITVPDYPGCDCGATKSDTGGSQGDSPPPNHGGRGSVGDPINVASGNMYESETDFATVGQNPLALRRFYNSFLSYMALWSPPYSLNTYSFMNSRFGYGWRSQYDQFVLPGSSGSAPNGQYFVDVVLADGEPVHFVCQPGTALSCYAAYWNNSINGWSTDPRTDIKITLTADSNYYYITDDQDTLNTYYPNGELYAIKYRNGYTQTLSYASCGTDNQNDVIYCNNSVSDSQGRQISFKYQSNNGLVQEADDSNGDKIAGYQYVLPVGNQQPLNGNWGMFVLQQVDYADGTAKTYSYNDPVNHFALTGVTDEDTNAYKAWTYDGATGRALSSQLGTGATADLTSIQYNDTNNTRQVTNALSKEFAYTLNPVQGRFQVISTEGYASQHTADSIIQYQYDEQLHQPQHER